MVANPTLRVSKRARIVLDASAVIAVVKLEPGSDKVADVLDRAVISAVNFSEVITSLGNQGMPMPRILEVLRLLRLEVLPYEEQQAVLTASFRAVTKSAGLSLGDRACLALGRLLAFPVMTGDTVWAKVDVGVDVRLFR
jgi:PIN domain nuclease of toxin-antitoxin system